ncbi:glycoside hydrolase family 78 protein [Diplodia corticola]|uniref:Glycoside hydrolase family 78 protein n=1 Tax=Diplodia corticola TaxID=236234 RepID=A0A1J9S111_9PEZI|nr:glycoside hydrolase family 78 protein [Diplodia corticola]OJD34271.1 glycoside hydrolase family 78 protein [Diplodia corticola]
MRVLSLLACFSFCVVASSPSEPEEEPWKKYIYSPSNRTVSPVSIHAISGDAIVTSDPTGFVLSLNTGAQVSLDYGIEVGGIVSFDTGTEDEAGAQLSLAFAESPMYVRATSDDATGSVSTQDWDRELNVSVQTGTTHYTMPRERFRGGFRFMTIVAKSRVNISNITCAIGFSPSQADLRDYSGYFWAPDDELLTKIWYAGAYTVQTNIGPVDTGRFLPQVKPGWAYNSTAGVAGPILMDGAKRDRAVWPGDHAISGTTAFLALGDAGLEAFRNALETMFYYQNSTTGRFPYAGPSTRSFNGGNASDTYHAWNLISIFNYAIYTTDEAWVSHHWSNITAGVDYILAGLAASPIGLHNQSTPYDWGRQGAGGYSATLNALDHLALTSLSSLASALHHPAQSRAWSAAAAALKSAYNTHLWDPAASLYRDNTTTTELHPQDGNALALLSRLPRSPAHASALSAALAARWADPSTHPFGPVAPELPDTVSPFVCSVEALAHLSVSAPPPTTNLTTTLSGPTAGLALIHRLWHHLLTSPTMTGSTFAEGISANGSLHYRGGSGYNFDPAYTSMAHGWATGPTGALTARVAGLEVVGWRGWRWGVAREVVGFGVLGEGGGVREVRAGFGKGVGGGNGNGRGEGWGVWWRVVDDVGEGEGRGVVVEAEVMTPGGTEGVVELGEWCERVTVDGVAYEGGMVAGGGTREVRGVGCRL